MHIFRYYPQTNASKKIRAYLMIKGYYISGFIKFSLVIRVVYKLVNPCKKAMIACRLSKLMMGTVWHNELN